jgi:membrane-associated protein
MMVHVDLPKLIETVGYIGLFIIVFAESGLLIGFFLPGDSLLFTAGFLASQGILSLPILLVSCFVAAVLGDNVGYAFGHKIGKRIFKKEDSLLFHKDHITRAQRFYEQHGPKTIVLARFLPVIRTFAPIVAGVGSMQYRTFMTYNLVGGAFWAVGLTLSGYFLGYLIPDIDAYLIPIILIIIVLSVLPSAWHVLKEKHHRQQIISFLKKRIER